VEGLPGQGAHKLSRVSRANCFVILPAENAGVAPGDTVEIEPFAAPA
jgi:molybdopterin biosynthesis enzyme